MIRKNFHIGKLQDKQLKHLQEKTGISVAEHVRRAIDAYVVKNLAMKAGPEKTEVIIDLPT